MGLSPVEERGMKGFGAGKSPRLQCYSKNVLARPTESPLAKVAHQRGPTYHREGPELVPCCAQSLTERSLWEVWLQWEPGGGS